MQLDNEKRDITESLYDIVAMRLYKLLSLLQNNDTHKFILMFLCIVVATSRNRGVIRYICILSYHIVPIKTCVQTNLGFHVVQRSRSAKEKSTYVMTKILALENVKVN